MEAHRRVRYFRILDIRSIGLFLHISRALPPSFTSKPFPSYTCSLNSHTTIAISAHVKKLSLRKPISYRLKSFHSHFLFFFFLFFFCLYSFSGSHIPHKTRQLPHLSPSLHFLSSKMATYTPHQIHSYLAHIGFPNPSVAPPPTLETLKAIISHHLSTIPFENLSMHYRPSHSPSPDSIISPIDITSAAAIAKLVPLLPSSEPESTAPAVNGDGAETKEKKQSEEGEGEGRPSQQVSPPSDHGSSRGGYCMEVNTVLSTVLRTLGFTIWTIGGRASLSVLTAGKDTSGGYGGWDHMASIVDLDDDFWFVDVGFGGNGPLEPIRLKHGQVVYGQGKQRHRLVKRAGARRGMDLGWAMQIGEVLDDGDTTELDKDVKSAVIEVAEDGKRVKWSDGCNFYPQVEFTERDYAVMSFATSTKKDATFQSIMMCARMLREDEIPEEHKGEKGRIVILDKFLRRKIGDKLEILKEFACEEERVEALKEWFGIVVDRESIRGGRLEIKEASNDAEKKN